MALTIKEIDNAKPTDKPYRLAHSGGLCLLVPPSGGKLWRWRYRFEGEGENDGTRGVPRCDAKGGARKTL